MPTFDRSAELFKRARKVIPGGVSSENRAPSRGLRPGAYPLFMVRGRGSKIYDVDGNEYIDYLLGFGPLILGHAHPKVKEGVLQQIEEGWIFGLNHELECRVAEKIIRAVPSAEQVSFLVTGSEGTSAAIRLARAYTGKEKIARFDLGYVGWHDWSMIMPGGGLENNYVRIPRVPGVPQSVSGDIILLPWNRPQVVEQILKRHRHEMAAVICEPCPCGPAPIPPEGDFLKTLRESTEQLDILLIFDEVKTGFRLALGGGQEFYGVTPDISVFSKAVGSGFPLAAVTSTHEIMKPISEYRLPFWGTYNGSPLSLAAALATLTHLESAGAYEKLFEVSRLLVEGIKGAIQELQVEAIVQGPGPMAWTLFTQLEAVRNFEEQRTINEPLNRRRRFAFAEALAQRGIFCVPDHTWFISMAHTREDVHRTVEAVREALKVVKEAA